MASIKEYIHRQTKGYFRCPFHTKAKEEGTMLEVTLGTDREERLITARKAFRDFYANTDLTALLFTLPDRLTECTTFEKLEEELLPYQAELSAVQLDVRLYPFFPYHRNECSQEFIDQQLFLRPEYEFIATRVESANRMGGRGPLQSIADLSDNLLPLFTNIVKSNIDECLGIDGFLKIPPGGVEFDHELVTPDNADPTKNKNCFILVTGPLYPKEFGRYSKKN